VPIDGGAFEALAPSGVSVEATVVPRLGAALANLERPIMVSRHWIATSPVSITV
jgi:hypothetical protein